MSSEPVIAAVPLSQFGPAIENGTLPVSPGSGKEAREDALICVADEPEPEPQEFLVAGLIPRGHISGMIAGPGVGKSVTGSGLAVAVAQGTPFLDVTTECANVLFLEGEGMVRATQRHIWRISRGLGRSSPPRNIHILPISGSLLEDDVFDRCRRAVDDTGAEFVVADSLAALSYTSDSNAAGEMVAFHKRLRSLGATVLAIDHINKAAMSSGGKAGTAAGSVQKLAQQRSVMELTQARAGGLHLSHEKSNFGPRKPPITYAILFGPEWTRFELIDTNDPRLEGLEGLRPTTERVVAELEDYRVVGATAKAIADNLALTPKTISNALSTLKAHGKVESMGGGKWRLR
jgi:RecA-family ATPase